jgi:hypothetical protein
MAKIDIKGIDKAELLAALYNNAEPMGMGFFQARPREMTRDDALKMMDVGDDSTRMFPNVGRTRMYFDYVFGRPLKVNLEGDELETSLYNRDWGKNAAEQIVEVLRSNKR